MLTFKDGKVFVWKQSLQTKVVNNEALLKTTSAKWKVLKNTPKPSTPWYFNKPDFNINSSLLITFGTFLAICF